MEQERSANPKRKIFTSGKLRANFIKRLEDKDNFQNIESYWEQER